MENSAFNPNNGPFEGLFDNLCEGIHLQDSKGRILKYNASFLKMMGLSANQVSQIPELNVRAWRFVNEDSSPLPSEERPAAIALQTGVIQQGKSIGMYQSNGELIWLSVTAIPILPDSKGFHQQVLIVMTDVTIQRNNQKLIDDINERRAISFAALQYGTWDLNLKTQALVWDEYMYPLFGTKKEGFLGTFGDFAKILEPADISRVDAEMKEAFAKHAPLFRTSFKIKFENRSKYIACCARCLYDSAGQPLRMVGANWDITENVIRSRELESSQKLLRQIIDSTPDWILVKDLNHRLLLANESYAKALGKTPEEMVGKDDIDLGFPVEIVKGSPEKGTTGFWTDDNTIFKTGTTLVNPDDLAVVNGKEIHFHTVKAPLRNEENEIFGVLAYCRDLTLMHEKDQLLKEQQAKLLSASKMSALGEMAGGIAHEINTPLAIIVGQVELLQESIEEVTIPKEEIKQELDRLEKTAFRIAKIIKGLKSFSRNSDADPMEDVKFSQIIDDTLSLCVERFRNHDVELKTAFEDGVLKCRATQVSQVLMNLINNAYDAIEKLPEKWVSVESKIEEKYLSISITDSGAGIPEAVVQKMMNPFFTTKEWGRGTGLGLSISKGIVDEHKGTLTYDNTSKHTRFVLRLPLSEESALTRAS